MKANKRACHVKLIFRSFGKYFSVISENARLFSAFLENIIYEISENQFSVVVIYCISLYIIQFRKNRTFSKILKIFF